MSTNRGTNKSSNMIMNRGYKQRYKHGSLTWGMNFENFETWGTNRDTNKGTNMIMNRGYKQRYKHGV